MAKIKSASTDTVPVVKKGKKKEDKTEESPPLDKPSSEDALLDFNEAVEETVEPDGGVPPSPRHIKRMVEVAEGVEFELDKFRDSTRKYISVVSIGTGNKLIGVLKICQRILAKHERSRFEEWYYEQCESITDKREDWEDSGQTGDEPVKLDDWLAACLDEMTKSVYDALGVDSPKDLT